MIATAMPDAPTTSPRTAWLLLVAALVIGCLSFTLVKLALDELGALGLAAGRVTSSALMFTAIAAFRRTPRTPIARADGPRVLFIGLAASAGFHVLFNIGQEHVTVAMATVIMATMPVMTAVGEMIFLRHRLDGAQAGGLALSTAGCLIIALAAGSGEGGGSSALGVLLVAAAYALWSAVTLMTRSIGDRYDSWWLYTPGAVLGALVMLAVAAPDLHEYAGLSLGGWLIVVWLGTASSAFIYYAFARVLTVVSATTTTAANTVITPGGALIAWAVLGERPTLAEAVGGAVVIAGVLVLSRSRR